MYDLFFTEKNNVKLKIKNKPNKIKEPKKQTFMRAFCTKNRQNDPCISTKKDRNEAPNRLLLKINELKAAIEELIRS